MHTVSATSIMSQVDFPIHKYQDQNSNIYAQPEYTRYEYKESPYAWSDMDLAPPRPPDPEIYTPPTRHRGPIIGRDHRRTWSPPAFSQLLVASQLHAMRSYRSNEQLEQIDSEPIYEELPDPVVTPGPPRLPPISGKLQNVEGGLIKPVAYKPVVSANLCYVGSPQTSPLLSSPPPSLPSPPASVKSVSSPPSVSSVHTTSSIHSKHHSTRQTQQPQAQQPSRPSPPKQQSSSPLSRQPTVPLSSRPSPRGRAGVRPLHDIRLSQDARSEVTRPSPSRSHDMKLASPDDGYVSQEYNSHSHLSNQKDYNSHANQNVKDFNAHSQEYKSQEYNTHINQNVIQNRTSHTPHKMSNSFQNVNSNNSHITRDFALKGFQMNPHLHPANRSASYGDLTATKPLKAERYARSEASRIAGDVGLQTPSPSDSGVGELEAMMRDKDAEIQALRETMAANENAMIKVHEEKRQNWEMEVREVSEQWENRLRLQQQKTFKMEQALLLQLFKLQQERKTLRLDCEQLRTEKASAEDSLESVKSELAQSRSALEELRWDMCQKTGEISLLKQNVKQSNNETSNRSHEVVSLRSQVKELQSVVQDKESQLDQLQEELKRLRSELQTVKGELETRHKLQTDRCVQTDLHLETPPGASVHPGAPVMNLSSEYQQMQTELLKAQSELQRVNKTHEIDREQWLDEKNKVIRYQKHLQLNYVQMYKKNRTLEAEIEQLMVELENRDLRMSEEVEPMSPGHQESSC